MREEVQDRYGNTIYLTDERWRHIIKRHPQLTPYRVAVLRTIRLGRRSQDVLQRNKFYYNHAFKSVAPFQEVEVVVVFDWANNQPNNFVVTAYPA